MDFSDSHRLAQYGRSKATIHEFIEAQMNGACCLNCHEMYVPALDMGRRVCCVHPRASSGQSVTPGHLLKYGQTERSLPEHYACCGKSVRDAPRGCTRADHWTGAERWMPLYPGEARDDVHVSFNQSLSYDRSQHHAAAWVRVLPTFLLPLMGRDVDEVIAATQATEYTSVSSILRPDGQGRVIVIETGTHRLHVDLRDAYIHMTTTFGLPRDCLARQSTARPDALLSGASGALQETLRLAIPTYGRQTTAGMHAASSSSAAGDAMQELSKAIFGRTLGNPKPQPVAAATEQSSSRRAVVQRADYVRNPERAWKVIDRALEPLFLNPLNAFFPFIVFAWMNKEPEPLERMY